MKRSLFMLALGAALFGPDAFACQMVGGPLTPAQLIARADLVVRVTALAAAADGGVSASVRFRIEEVLKGEDAPGGLVLTGNLEGHDDFNGEPVPYRIVRPEGRSGGCFASGYRSGAQYLLFLRGGEGEYTARWAGLAPVNEQLRSPDDEWLRWVRSHVRSE